MAKFKNEGFDELFQKLFPLKLVSLDDMPQPRNLLPSQCLDLDEYLVLANHMIDLCRKNKGVGLSAVQCGLPLKFFVASQDGQNFRCFLDAFYDGTGPLIDSLEGCLSIIDSAGQPKRFLLKRYSNINFRAFEILIDIYPCTQTEIKETVAGFFSVVLQHEIDHHEGKLISDLGQEVEIIN